MPWIPEQARLPAAVIGTVTIAIFDKFGPSAPWFGWVAWPALALLWLWWTVRLPRVAGWIARVVLGLHAPNEAETAARDDRSLDLRVEALRTILRQAAARLRSPDAIVTGGDVSTARPLIAALVGLGILMKDGFKHHIGADYGEFMRHHRRTKNRGPLTLALADYCEGLAARLTAADVNERFHPPTSFDGLLGTFYGDVEEP